MPFSYSKLPGEVRNQILRLLLTHRTPIVIHHYSLLGPPVPTSLSLSPSILLINRATYEEGCTILYGENTFQAHPMLLTEAVFALWASRPISQRYLHHVKRFHVRVRLDNDPFYSVETVQAAFNDADELELEVFRVSFEAGSYSVLERYAGVRGIQKAKVHGSIDTGYARWLENRMMSKHGEGLEKWEEQGFAVLDSLRIDTAIR